MAPSDNKNEVLKEEEKKKSLNDRLRESKDSILDETETPESVLSPQETRELVLSEIKTNIGFCAKAAQTNEVRYLTRVLRKISSLRRKLTTDILQELILSYFPDNLISKENLLNYLEELSKDEMQNESNEVKSGAEKIVSIGEEVEVFLHLLLNIYLLDKARFDLAVDCSNSLIARLKEEKFNKRTLDPLRASAYFYYSRCYEKQERLSDIRSNLLAAYRTATLRHDNITQTTVLNLLLRNFISYNLYDQADKLLSKTTFKEASTTSNQFARYLFYTGKIKAIQLDYTEAYKCLVQAIRKCPQNTALGFRKIATKFAIIVQLLMGEIPEKSLFRQKGLSQSLTPYYKLTLAVRIGDLAKFKTEVQNYEEHFHRDKTYSLIQRLRHNVIKTGLKKINSSYSRISLVDVAAKLHLDNVQDAEFIVAKAIRDGVIDASIDHAGGFIQSKDSDDIYTTQEPLEAFHRRITFCMNIHNDAVIAMRFPQGTEKTKKEENSEDDRTQDAIITLDEESDDEEIF